MWIVFFNDVPSFWLVNGETYCIGKKDCHMVIHDDRSISRLHLTVQLGLPPLHRIEGVADAAKNKTLLNEAVAPISLVDSSTYGTVVYSCGGTVADDGDSSNAVQSKRSATEKPAAETSAPLQTGILGLQYVRSSGSSTSQRNGMCRGRGDEGGTSTRMEASGGLLSDRVTLTKGEAFRAPLDRPEWREFCVQLGNHGATFKFLWVGITAVVEDVNPDHQTKLEHALMSCGVSVLSPASFTEEDAGRVTRSGLATGGVVEKTTSHELALSASQSHKSAAAASTGSFTAQAACYQAADFLVTATLQPSAAVVAFLCRAAPIVSPAFFAAVRDRASPQVPLPDPRRYLPPVSLFWRGLIEGSGSHGEDECHHKAIGENGEEDSDASAATTQESEDGDEDEKKKAAVERRLKMRGAEEMLQPLLQRQTLFAGITFVVFQRALYEEVVQYVECAQGRVLWDGDCLASIVNARSREAVLRPFFARHHRHVVLYNETERMPFRGCLSMLRDTLRMSCCEYGQLVEAIAKALKLQLSPFPSSAAALSASGSGGGGALALGVEEGCGDRGEWDASAAAAVMGRPTDPNPLFPDMEKAAAVGTSISEGPPCVVDATRHVDADGWITRDENASHSSYDRKRHRSRDLLPRSVTDDDQEARKKVKVANTAYALPPYPCFQPYEGSVSSTAAATTVSSGRFVKQRVAPAEAPVELESPYTAIAAGLLSSRVPGVDSEEIVPDNAVMGRIHGTSSGGGGGVVGMAAGGSTAPFSAGVSTVVAAFNAFDTVAHNSINKKKGTARKGKSAAAAAAAEAGRRAALGVAQSASGVAVPSLAAFAERSEVEVPSDGNAHSGSGGAGGGGAFNIFDVEGIF